MKCVYIQTIVCQGHSGKVLSRQYHFSHASAKVEHDLFNCSCVCMCLDQNKEPPQKWHIH